MEFKILYSDIDKNFVNETANLVSELNQKAIDKEYEESEGRITDFDLQSKHQLDNRLQKLEGTNIVFKITDITMLQYLMIANIKRLNVDLEVDYDNLKFADFDLDDEYLNHLYSRCKENTIMWYDKIRADANGINGVTDDCAKYILPLAQLCNVKIITNGKKFLKLLSTFIKYDEISDIADCISDDSHDEMFLENCMFLSTLVEPYEIYLREMVEPVLRGELIDNIDEDGVSLMFETNLQHLFGAGQLLTEKDYDEVTTTSYMTCSALGYIELLKLGYADRLRTENLYHVLTTEREHSIELAFPHQLYGLYYIHDLMDVAIGWCELIERCIDIDEYDKRFVNFIPNALLVVFRYIGSVGKDETEEIDLHGFEEVANIQFTRKQEIVNAMMQTIATFDNVENNNKEEN